MRLLRVDDVGFTLTKELEEDSARRYMILSHTWSQDPDEEVTFQDVASGDRGSNKKGFRKLEFCTNRARRDGTSYCWVDTCCIDKTNSVELNSAIASMFRWYAGAAKCYVYLSDVTLSSSNPESEEAPCDWLSDFRRCRWMARGWTLQELLAPRVVEFYDQAGRFLGTKVTLERHICEVTGIPVQALRGRPLSSFTMEERFHWQMSRTTKRLEDRWYSLMGICGVSVVPLYGEGEDNARARLQREIDDTLKGPKRQDFAIPYSDMDMVGVEKFVAREEELEEIRQSLAGDGRRRTVILHGLGGIGKTQLAVAYARRNRDNYSAVLWLSLENENSIKRSFSKAATLIARYHSAAKSLSNIGPNASLDDCVEAVKAWLSEAGNTRWLVIFDNYDNPKIPSNTNPDAIDIRTYLPEAFQGSVIITTRVSHAANGVRVPVKKLISLDQSLEILSNSSRRRLSSQDSSVATLLRKLDGLPLALATAGAYLDQVSVSVADYLVLYEDSWLQLHESDPGLPSYDRTLYSTWRLSLDRIEQQNLLSAKLLGLWCYFNNRDLWFELLRAGRSDCVPWLQELTANLLIFTKAIRLLCDYGLVEAEAELVGGQGSGSGGYGIHSCVHVWSKYALNLRMDPILARLALMSVGRHAPGPGAVTPWITQRRLLPHADRCLEHLRNGLLDEVNDVHWALNQLGAVYLDQSKLSEAEAMYDRALQLYDTVYGPEHESTLATVSNLGNLYRVQGNLEQAKKMHQRALQDKKANGSDRGTMLKALENLAQLHRDQGKFAEAERLCQQVLDARQTTLGLDDEATLRTMVLLGLLCREQGRIAEAGNILQQALAAYENAVGPGNIAALHAANDLGAIYADQGRLNEAEGMYRRALQGFEQALGSDHTSTLTAALHLGNIYMDRGDLIEAENIFRRTLQGCDRALGPRFTTTPRLQAIYNLGAVLYYQGKHTKAEAMLQRALREREKALGSEHPLTSETVTSLGLVYLEQGRLAEAEASFERAIEDFDKALGPGTLTLPRLLPVINLGLLYFRQGKLVESEAMLQRALQGYDKLLGPDAQTVYVLNLVHNLGTVYFSQGKLNEAEAMWQRAFEGYEKVLGPERFTSGAFITVQNLGLIHGINGKVVEAESRFQQAIQGLSRLLGSGHVETRRAVDNLCQLYTSQGRVADAIMIACKEGWARR